MCPSMICRDTGTRDLPNGMRSNFARAWHLLRMREVIQIAEWGKVELPPRFDNPKTKARLLRQAASPFGNALVLRGQNLYAQGLVGVIDAGPLQLQIVPKVYTGSTA